jgi:gliding motility-associated-like protein
LCKDKLWTLKKFNFKINKNVTLSFLGRYCKHFNLRGENNLFSPLFYYPNFIPFLLLLSFYLPTHAQNLITNGSFEEGRCPTKDFLYNTPNGVSKESGWLNVDTADRVCGISSCIGDASGTHLFIQDLTADFDTLFGNLGSNKCCGEGCNTTTPTKRFSGPNALTGILRFDSSGFERMNPYIAQRLQKTLTLNHKYHLNLFYSLFGYGFKMVEGEWALMNQYLGFLTPPNTTHNGFGVAFSSYHMVYPEFPLPNTFDQTLLPSETNQRKLRFTLQYQRYWQKLAGTFVADSNYSYLTIGNFWSTEETTFTPPLSGKTIGTGNLYLDSINMWDVTHHLSGDTQYCSGQNAMLTSEHYSRGYTVWYNKQGDSLHTGDTFNFSITTDTFIRSIRYFPDIEYSTADSISLFVKNTTPEITLSRSTDPCSLPATFTVLPENEYTYSWNNMLGTNQYTTIDSQTIHLLVTDTNGCYFGTSFFVWPEVAFSASLLSDTCDLTAEISLEPDTYQYTVNGTSSSTTYFGNLSGRVTIIATQANGCKDTQYIAIPICIVPEDNLWIPNAFTPNTDDLNRTFAPLSQYIKTYELNIYNRWGEHIFQSTDANPGWDGTFQNKIAQQGSYLYTVTITLINGKRIQRSGQIMLLR